MDWECRERRPSLRWGEVLQCSLLAATLDQPVLPRFLPQGQDREGVTCFHQTRIWGHPAQLQGKSQGLAKPWTLKG